MTLCREVYHCSPSRLLQEMPLREFRLWRAYYSREGSWDQRADLRNAINTHAIATQKGWEYRIFRRRERVDYKTFMPVLKDRGSGRPVTGEQLHAKLTAFAQMLQRNDRRAKRNG